MIIFVGEIDVLKLIKAKLVKTTLFRARPCLHVYTRMVLLKVTVILWLPISRQSAPEEVRFV